MAEKDDARRNIEHARDSMSEIAEELMRRSSPEYVKARAREVVMQKTYETRDRAKEAVMRKTVETRERVKESPMAWRIIGGAVGVGIASLLSRRYQEARTYRADWREDYQLGGRGYRDRLEMEPTYAQRGVGMRSGVVADSYGYAAVSEPTAGVYAEPLGAEADLSLDRHEERGRAAELKERAASKASDLKDRASSAADSARSAVSSKAEDLRGKAADLKESARERLGGVKERLTDVRHSASGRLHDAKLGASERLGSVRERMPTASDVKARASATWQRGVNDEPLAIVLGAIALGAAASFLIPVSDKERQLLAPAKDRVRVKLDEVKEEARSRIDQVRGQAIDQLSQLKGQAQEGLESFKGQAIAGLKGQQPEQGEEHLGSMDTSEDSLDLGGTGSSGNLNLGLATPGSTAHADSRGVYTSPAADAPEELRSPGIVQHDEKDRPTEQIGSYDPKLTH